MICKIYMMDRGEILQGTEVKCFESPIPELDINIMYQDYYEKKKSMLRMFEKFKINWDKEYNKLPNPQAGIIRWDKEFLNKVVKKCDMSYRDIINEEILDQITCVYAVVWTIGPDLENKSQEILDKNLFEGMFLDVAGSLYMGQIRRCLHQFITSYTTKNINSDCFTTMDNSLPLELLGEFIPESGLHHSMIRAITDYWTAYEGQNKPFFSVNESDVLRPLKTQCALFFVGENTSGREIILNEIPCSDCKGSKCLYLQFGGCHMPKSHKI